MFSEQAVASHAVRVAVTEGLSASSGSGCSAPQNSSLGGFLPVHCVHQLLKSRVFSKHRVPVKDWIYRFDLERENAVQKFMLPVHNPGKFAPVAPLCIRSCPA